MVIQQFSIFYRNKSKKGPATRQFKPKSNYRERTPATQQQLLQQSDWGASNKGPTIQLLLKPKSSDRESIPEESSNSAGD